MSDLKNMFSLEGRKALITGGGTGIGLQIAEVFAAHGAKVVLAARRKEILEGAVASLKAKGADASYVVMDITDNNSIDAGLEKVCAGGAASILVNCAGMTSKSFLLDTSEDEWDVVLDTNLKGAWRLSQALCKRLIEAGSGGSIINIASILGLASQRGTGAYMVSKAGLIHLTRNMAHEWARHGIRVNAVAPGYFETDISKEFLESRAGQSMLKNIPLRRLGNVSELSGIMLLLASEAGAYMTGGVHVVDGGHAMAKT